MRSGRATPRATSIADVTDAKAVDNGVRQAVAARGPVDLLVANAGSADSAPFAKATPDQFRDMFELQRAWAWCIATQAVLGGMIERGFGRIVAVASIVGLRATPNVSAYCTAKHALVGLVRSLALETAGSGVTVNAVCPGYTDTDLIRGPLDRLVDKSGRRARRRWPRFTSRRPARPAGQAARRSPRPCSISARRRRPRPPARRS